MGYIIQIYNYKTNDIIGYIISRYEMTDDINKSYAYDEDLGLINYAKDFVENVYKVHKQYSTLEHDFGHIKEDYFKDVNKNDIWFKILNKDIELRKLKIGKIKKG